MMDWLPSKKELAILLTFSALCTLIVAVSPQRDVGLMWCGGSIALAAALLGYRRNQIRLAALRARVAERPTVMAD
jgi:hypothetical protein